MVADLDAVLDPSRDAILDTPVIVDASENQLVEGQIQHFLVNFLPDHPRLPAVAAGAAGPFAGGRQGLLPRQHPRGKAPRCHVARSMGMALTSPKSASRFRSRDRRGGGATGRRLLTEMFRGATFWPRRCSATNTATRAWRQDLGEACRGLPSTSAIIGSESEALFGDVKAIPHRAPHGIVALFHADVVAERRPCRPPANGPAAPQPLREVADDRVEFTRKFWIWPSTSWFSEGSPRVTGVSRIGRRLGSKTASRSATHFGRGGPATDIGSPPRALRAMGKRCLARAPNVAPHPSAQVHAAYNLCERDRRGL